MNLRVLIRPKSGDEPQEVLVPAEEPFVLGRGPTSAAFLDGPGISREHLAVCLDGSNILVTDLSVNGAWVNGKRLPANAKYRMNPGEVVELPGYEVKFQAVNSPALTNTISNDQTQSVRSAEATVERRSIPGVALVRSFSFIECVLITAAALSLVLAVVYFVSY